jgi:peptidoglycan hydrolase-like protein with peptidoglycan-binding domain
MTSVNVHRIISTAIVLLVAGLGIALTPAVPAAAAASCTGFTTVADIVGGPVNVPSVGNGTGNLNCLLGQGNVSGAVSTLQFTLNQCYGSGLTIDGNFGPLTRAALEAAQRREGITADGVYGPQTRDSLHWQEVGGSFACVRLTITV